MSIDETLLTLSLELAENYDPDLNTSEGSSFRTQFLDPLLTRIGGSPLDVDLETFLVERLQTEIPGVDVSNFSALRDLTIRAFIAMADPLRREINGVKVSQSLNNYDQMTRAEVNALLGNYFTELQSGAVALGTGRLYYSVPQSVVVSPLTQFSTGNGLNFFPTGVQQINATQMSFQQTGNLYYWDVSLQAEGPGEQYNIEAGSLISVSGLSGVTRVTNLTRFSSGLTEETKEEGIARTRNSITIRNLITNRGVAFVIPENFPEIEILQVIGFSDPEMRRDVLTGLSDISDIPDGITGRNPLTLTATDSHTDLGAHIHIGGKTDIYVYQAVPDSDSLDIEDLTDKGFRVYAGSKGETVAGPSTSFFDDEFGFFQNRGVAAGDFLLLDDAEYEITDVPSQTRLDISPNTVDGGLFGRTYDIVRKQEGLITVPLYDLVAVDSDGLAVFDSSGNAVAPIPGSPTNEQLLNSSGDPIAKTDNISIENVQLPLLRITSIEFLDPLTLEALGTQISMKDLMAVTSPDGLTGGDAVTVATGSLRLFFKDPVNAYVTYTGTRFSAPNGRTYRPILGLSGTNANSAGSVITLPGDQTALIAVGDRLQISGTFYSIVGPITLVGLNTEVTVRETIASPIVAAPWAVHVGILQSNMGQDAATGLYFFDVSVEALVVGTDGNQDEETTFGHEGVSSEGWSLRTTRSVLSYSTRELPYLEVTPFVNDTTELGVTFTAPAIRLSYEFASSLQAIQEFADSDDNRIVSEDVLIRHFTPSYVRASFQIRDLDAETGLETIAAFINSLSPTADLQVSDIVDSLYSAGASHVVLPVTLVGLAQGRDRSWSGVFSEDALSSSRIQHYIAEEDEIDVTVL